MLNAKKLIELKIKKIHCHYSYPADWSLSYYEFEELMEKLGGASRYDNEDELEDAIDCGLRIDSNTGRIFYTGYQVGIPHGVFYYHNEQDALDRINEITGIKLATFKEAEKRWDEFEPYHGGPILHCRITCTM